MLWDLFCRVIDNWGDVGVCARLAADLRARGEQVRLWVDDPRALAWMAPQAGGAACWDAHTPWPVPGDVVIEAFGCELPDAFVERMAAQVLPPVWINLEYLSAEPYAPRCHGLRSPQQGAALGLAKYFYYPGWQDGTGGLMREPNLAQRQAAFDPAAWLAAQGVALRPDEQRVSLFCYRNPALPRLLTILRQRPTLLLVTSGLAAEQVRAWLGATAPPVGDLLRIAFLPLLSQADFDHLLWSCDVNLVRGEDSFVRAQWADRPFVWQIYPQDDGAHIDKLEAWHRLWAGTVDLPPAALALSRAWNGLANPADPWPWPTEWGHWQAASQAWGRHLRASPDLVTRLRAFVDSHRSVARR
ncbi:MAG: elongation factor P maturation arginine rhamnosyltransferase EarP [Pseudomonadota bacterium]